MAASMIKEEISKCTENEKFKSYRFEEKTITENISNIMSLLRYYVERLYIIFWHELSMDPAIKPTCFTTKNPEEKKLSNDEIFTIRRRRVFFIFIHLSALYGLYCCLTGKVKLYSIIWGITLGAMSSLGVTAGAHRLWSHRSYKAKWPLRLILVLFQTLSVQYSVYNWVKDHRLHHKHTDTDADPHNSNRGFFFSHIGWSLILPHPDVVTKLKTIDMTDMQRDKIIMFQYKNYAVMAVIFAYVIPIIVPWCLWGEDILIAHAVCAQLRHVLTLHGTFLINSAAHMWGSKPYDKNINPTENMFVSAASFGDGWHNYHHVFPWDYKNAELLNYKLNLSTLFVDTFAKIGWAYDLKSVSPEIAAKRALRTGDGSHASAIWGWNDKDLSNDEKKLANIKYEQISS